MATVSWKHPVSGNWTLAADWSNGAVPGAGDDVTIGVLGGYTVAVTSAIAVHSLTLSDPAATLTIKDPGVSEKVTANFTNAGAVALDAAAGGGTALSIGGALANSGLFAIGNAGLAAATTVAAASLANTGEIDLTGGTAQATLDVTGATPATLTGSYVLEGNALLEVPSTSVSPSGGGITAIAGHAELVLDGAEARVAVSGSTASNSGLTGLAANAGTLAIQRGSKIAAGGAFANNGLVEVDNDIFGTGDAGGSSLAVAGVLTNRGDLDIGNGGLTIATSVSAAALANTATGTVNLTGGAAQASLTVGGAAPATLTGFYYLAGGALLQFGAGHVTTIGVNSELRLHGAGARVALAANPASNSALTLLAANNGIFDLEDHAAVAIATGLVNRNTLDVDTLGGGGSRLTIAGTLTNAGDLAIGGGSLVIGGAPALVSAAGLADTGTIELTGGPGRATLDILGAALPTVTGSIDLTGNALLEFGSGGVATIASGGRLDLDGTRARVALNSDPTTSGALARLASNAGSFILNDGATVATTVGFNNTGTLELDAFTLGLDAFEGGSSSLSIGGVLTNDSSLDIGNSRILAATTLSAAGLANTGSVDLTGGAATQATFNVGGAAPATLTGSYDLAGDALLDFKSGGVTAIGPGSSLFLDGALSRVALASAPGSNSALAGLASNAGTLALQNGAALTTKVAFNNAGTIEIDNGFGGGGSSLALGGALTNKSALDIGNASLSKTTTVTAPGLVNSGTVELTGGAATQATLHIIGPAPATLTGSYSLSGDAILEYNSGGIAAIGAGASLTLNGALSRVALTSAPATDSALLGLTSNAGTIVLENGAALATKVGLTNSGFLDVDFAGGSGGGGLAIGGALANNSGADIDIGNASLAAPATVTAASLTNAGALSLVSGVAAAALKITGAVGNTDLIEIDTGFGAGGGSLVTIGGMLTNSDSLSIGNSSIAKATTVTAAGLANTGTIAISGGAAALAKLNIASAAAPTLTGNYSLSGDALLEFASGGITAIANGASLTLNGSKSLVALASAPTTDSALAGLASNAGTLTLENGASLTTTTGLASSGTIAIDSGFGATGGSTLSIGGALASSFLTIGNSGMTAATTARAASLVNSGTLDLTSGAAAASLKIAGAFTNTGFAEIDSGFGSAGGSLATIGGTLTNSDSLTIGATSLAKATTVTAAGLADTGTIDLIGGAAALAKLDIAGAAPAALGGTYSLGGDALLEFASGGITSIASGASLTLNGAQALVALAGKLTTDSALAGLASNAGTLNLENGAVLTTTTGLANSGSLGVDSGFGALGGSNLGIGGTLSNSAFNFTIGNTGLAKAATVAANGLANTGTINLTGGAAAQAKLDITAAAPATLTGGYNLSGDALLEFASGGITAIGSGASLTLNGAQALVALAGKLTTDSALAGLASNAGTLNLENGAVLTTTTGVANSGSLGVDSGFGALGGSKVTIGGALTNSSFETIAIGNTGLTSATAVSAASLANAGNLSLSSGAAAAASLKVAGAFGNTDFVAIDTSGGGGSSLAIGGALTNSATFEIGNAGLAKATTATAGGLANTGTIDLSGGAAATLDITGPAPAILTGTYNLSGDALLEFASGGATSIASGASLTLNGPQALVALAGKLTTNSALSGLSGNAGTLTLENGAALTTTTGLTNSGTLSVDSGFGAVGGSALTIGGVLTNSNSLSIGNSSIAKATTVKAAGLANTDQINLTGSATATATLDITAAAPATLSGTFDLSGDALLEYASGVITAIGSGTSLTLNGAQAFLALASKLTSNSALTGLASNAGTLVFENGSTLATTTGFNNTGTLRADTTIGDSGSGLNLGGTLTNSGSIGIGAAATVSASSLANSGEVTIFGGAGADKATFSLAGASTNSGDIFIGGGGVLALGSTMTLTTGTFGLDGGTISGGTLAGSGASTGTFETDTLSHVTISAGFSFFASEGDTLDVNGVTVNGALRGGGASTTLNFVNNGTDDMTNVSGFATIGLASGAADMLALADANFAGISSGAITVNDGNSGNTVNGASLSAGNFITVNAGSGADMLTGGAGNDVFFAGGKTTMTGNAGTNEFAFNAAGASNTIADFGASTTNELVFSNAAFNLGQSGAGTTPQALPVALFTANATGAFANSSQRLAYDTANGNLFASANGSASTPQLVATLTGHPSITAASQLFFIS